MKNLADEKRIYLLKKTILFFFLAGIALSFKLWISDRNFPLAPVFSTHQFLNFPIDHVFAFLLLLALGINLFYWTNGINLFAIAILFILLLQDQTRWQPWVYIYFLFLLLFSFTEKIPGRQNHLLTYLRVVTIGIYFWSGVHKLNPNFLDITFENILTHFLWFKDVNFISTIKPFGYFIPVVEIGISIFLFFPKSRNLAVYFVIITHLFILVYLSPLGIDSNSVVFPWNVAMIFIVFFLFYNAEEKIDLKNIIKKDLMLISVLLLTWMFPVLSFFGFWDNYLSFDLYSSKSDEYYIVIAEDQLNKVDKKLKPYYLPARETQGGKIINMNRWALEEMNVPFYPQSRAFKKAAKAFCKFGIPEDKLYFLELTPPLKKPTITRFTCNDLEE